MYAFIIQNIHIVCNFLHIIRKHVAYKRVRRNTFYKLNYFMQKTLLITTSILMIFVISGCSQKTIKNNTDVSQTNNQNIFSELKSKTYTQNLSLEEAYKIIEPFVSKWASDAVLTKYLTSLPTSNNNYSSPYFEFDSPKNKKTLAIGFNHQIYNDMLISDPKNFKKSNKFTTYEFDWTKESDWVELSDEEMTEAKLKYANSKMNNVDNYVNSETIKQTALKDGLNNFIDKYKNLDIRENSIKLTELNERNIEWQVIFWVGEPNSIKITHTFTAKYNPITGELINKSEK